MGLQFPGSGANYIDLGDIANARFDANSAWTFLVFVELSSYGATRILAAKGDTSGQQQFSLRTDASADPADLEVFMDDVLRVELVNALTGTGWRLAVVSSDGLNGASSLTLRLFDMTGAQLASGTGQPADAADQTQATHIGIAEGSVSPMDEVMDIAAYFTRELTLNQCRAFSRAPFSVLRQHGGECEYWVKMGVGAGGIVDWSGNKVGSVVGSLSNALSPPIQPVSMPTVEPFPPVAFTPETVAAPPPPTQNLLHKAIQFEGGSL